MKAGFVGLGHIGRGMAQALVESGLDTAVYDLFPEGPAELAAMGATAAQSPADVALHSEVMGVCVRSDQDVLDVFEGANGILAAGRPGLLVAVHSTVRPSTVHRVAEMAAAKGVRVVDAPVSRGAPNAEGKSIVYMLGGSEQDIADVRAFVATAAKQIIVAGSLGAAMALKACNNLVTYLEFLAAVEADRLARRTGLDPALLLEVMIANGNATPSMQALMKNRFGMSGAPDDPMRQAFERSTVIAEKDLDCALEAAAEVGLDLPGAKLVRGRMRDVYLGSVDGN